MEDVRLLLTDESWERLSTIIAEVESRAGAPPETSDREFVEAVLYRARTGSRGGICQHVSVPGGVPSYWRGELAWRASSTFRFIRVLSVFDPRLLIHTPRDVVARWGYEITHGATRSGTTADSQLIMYESKNGELHRIEHVWNQVSGIAYGLPHSFYGP